MAEHWDGTERRTDYLSLSSAIAEVRGLKESVLVLAEAMGKTMGRDELLRAILRTNIFLMVNIALNICALALLVWG